MLKMMLPWKGRFNRCSWQYLTVSPSMFFFKLTQMYRWSLGNRLAKEISYPLVKKKIPLNTICFPPIHVKIILTKLFFIVNKSLKENNKILLGRENG